MQATYTRNVFINCPFDTAYKPILDAVTFVVLDAGFVPHTALQETDTGVERLRKILRLIGKCQYSIHDVSRVQASKKKLVRFNMPFECGLSYGALHFGDKVQRRKRVLVLDSEPFRYQASISDIAGKDIGNHQNDPLKAIACVRRFLSGTGAKQLPGAAYFQRRYEHWQRELPAIARRAGITKREALSLDYWRDYMFLAAEWLK